MEAAVTSAYTESSQHLRWSFTPTQLHEKRSATNTSTTKLIRENIELDSKLSGKTAVTEPDFPTTEEELLIVNYYASKVFDTGAVFGLPSHLKATAAAYLKRFFLMKSTLQYHPKKIMITSLWLATKTCEYHIDLDVFVSKLPKQTKEAVLEHEFLISSTIGFDFMHWSAYKPLYGFILDMENDLQVQTDQSSAVTIEQITKAHDSAKSLLNRCIWSDLPFLHTPSLLALAGLYIADETLLLYYLSNKRLSHLEKSVKQISKDLKEVSTISFNTPEVMLKVKGADKKLYYASDPALKKDSALFKRRLVDQEREESAKRRKKGDAARESNDAFGSVLS